MSANPLAKLLKRLCHALIVAVGAVASTTAFFLVLPLMQAIAEMQQADTILQTVSTADVPPPPPPPEEEPLEETKEEEKPPELKAAPQNLDLAQLELALNPGFSEGLVGDGAFAVNLASFASATSEGQDGTNDLFNLTDLDQKPRVIYQPGPVLDGQLKKKAPATVHVIFVVDQRGKVENPLVQKSSDPAFERAALQAVKQWKFEPGKRGGKAVRFRMRVPMTFPAEVS